MCDLGRKFQFIINKIENNTLYISNFANQNSSEFNLSNFESPCSHVNTSNHTSNVVPYDSYGAARYIVVVVLVYGFGIIFFIGSQVRSTKKLEQLKKYCCMISILIVILFLDFLMTWRALMPRKFYDLWKQIYLVKKY